MNDGYEYDIFLSFPRAGGTFAWVRNHFHPVLLETLTDELGDPPKIFLYTEQENGLAWTANIVRSLQRSRYLVAVWGPTYFRSAWCLAEWESIRMREQLLGMRTVTDPRGLVYPVIYVNATNLPKEAQAIFSKSTANLSRWAVPMLQFKDTPDFVPFYNAMRKVAEELRDVLSQEPPWQEDWPVATPDDNGPRKPPSVKPWM
jgi:hypothetical protein